MRPEKLEDMAEYAESSVVSREIVRNPSGTVTLFAFDAGQGLSEHTAPFDAMVVVIDGEARISVAGESRVVVKGEMVIMPAGKPHSIEAEARFKMLLVMIKGPGKTGV